MTRWLLILCLYLAGGLAFSPPWQPPVPGEDACQNHYFGELQRTLQDGFLMLKRAITRQGREREMSATLNTVQEEQQNLRQLVLSLQEDLTSSNTQDLPQKGDAQEVKRLRQQVRGLKTSLTHLSEERRQEREAHRTELQQLQHQLSTTLNTCECPQTERGQEREEVRVNEDCSFSIVAGGDLRPYEGSSAPFVKFSELEERGCVHLEMRFRSWNESREVCRAMGGDLFVAGDLEGALAYIHRLARGRGAWVGARGWIWLDGRLVSEEEWGPEHPTGNDQNCPFAYQGEHSKGLRDTACSNNRYALCQMSASYP